MMSKYTVKKFGNDEFWVTEERDFGSLYIAKTGMEEVAYHIADTLNAFDSISKLVNREDGTKWVVQVQPDVVEIGRIGSNEGGCSYECLR
jgi:hypothetical protein